MTTTFIGNARVVAKVYDPEADIDYLFVDHDHARLFFNQLARYNSTVPLYFGMDD